MPPYDDMHSIGCSLFHLEDSLSVISHSLSCLKEQALAIKAFVQLCRTYSYMASACTVPMSLYKTLRLRLVLVHGNYLFLPRSRTYSCQSQTSGLKVYLQAIHSKLFMRTQQALALGPYLTSFPYSYLYCYLFCYSYLFTHLLDKSCLMLKERAPEGL